MKKTLISLTLAAAGFVALAVPASAHTPRVSHNCTTAGATLTVHLVQYEPGSTVTVNGVKSVFGTAEYDTTYPLGAANEAHTWTVVIDNRGDGMNKDDKYDQEFSDVVAQCFTTAPTTVPLEDKDLTPVVPPKVEYVNPAWPICMVPGKHLFNAHDPECVTDTVVMAPPMVLERAPVERQPAPVADVPVLAFTGPGRIQAEIALGVTLVVLAGVCLHLSNRAASRKAVQ